jgi:site-specific DNA recombinase
LHGQANRRDLSDPDDRFFLRIEVAHACRSSDDASRRLRDALEDRAREGRGHAGAQRSYGYAPGGTVIIEEEASVVREIFARYLEGDTPGQIARGLNERGIVTAQGLRWVSGSVCGVISSRHVTGIRVFRGEDFGDGDWPVIIDRGTWREAQDRRAYRAAARQRPFRFYVLRGLVMCKKCGKPMAGSANNHKPYYVCTRREDRDGTSCTRRIDALTLEAFVTDAALEMLSGLDVSGTPTATTALSEVDQAVIRADEAELAELKDMWDHRELSTREYRAMRKTVEDRITARRRKTIVRPTVEVLAGLVGPGARAAWEQLAERGEGQRMNAVLRFLFAAVIIDAHHGTPGTFDYSRIDIEPNPL